MKPGAESRSLSFSLQDPLRIGHDLSSVEYWGGGGRGGGRRLLNGISFSFHGEWRGVQSSPKEYEGGLWKSDCQCGGGGGEKQ